MEPRVGPDLESDGEIDSDVPVGEYMEGPACQKSNHTAIPQSMNIVEGEDIAEKEDGEVSGDDILSEGENNAGSDDEIKTKFNLGSFEDKSSAQENSCDANSSGDEADRAGMGQQIVEAEIQLKGDQGCRRHRGREVRFRKYRKRTNSTSSDEEPPLRKRTRHTQSTVGADRNKLRLARSYQQSKSAAGDGRERRKKREVFVGNCPSDCTAQAVQEAFDQAFLELPDYRRLYGDRSAVFQVHVPDRFHNRPGKSSQGDYLFVELQDELLARTAILMSGLRIDGVTVRVCPSASNPVFQEEDVLDVERLRQLGQIPWTGGTGNRFLCDVWLGGLSPAGDEAAGAASIHDVLGRHTEGTSKFQFQEFLKAQIEEALCEIPPVRMNFPDLKEFVVGLKMSRDKSCCFAEMANEVLASTLVAMQELPLRYGRVLKAGWPSSIPDAASRAAPPLPALKVKNSLLNVSLKDADDLDVCQHDFEGAQDCEIFISGTQGMEAISLWTRLTELLESLPSYREAYSEVVSPIVHIRLGEGSYSFARLFDARLASTATQIGFLLVRGVRLMLNRPSHYEQPPAGPEAPLEIPPSFSKSYQQSQDPAKLPASAEMLAKLPTPPPPPAQDKHVLWVGSIVSRGQRREWQTQQQQQRVHQQEDSQDEFPVRDLLDARLTELAMQIPGYDIDAGPPLQRVQVCEGGYGPYAFVEVAGSRERAEKLQQTFHGSDFLGKPLVVRWDRRPGQPERKETVGRRKLPAGIAMLLPGRAQPAD